MFKLSSLITTLVLGSSTAAMASSTAGSHGGHTTVRYGERFVHSAGAGRAVDQRWSGSRDLRGDGGPPRYRPTWVELGAPIQLADGRDSIAVGDRGTFTQLRLQMATGASRLDRVVICFADGSQQVVDVDRVLDRQRSMFEIQLDGNNRRIDRVIIDGGSSRRGELLVYGI
jgi:hypothetical protein